MNMLRLTEIKLPLDHSENDLKSALLKKLKIKPESLVHYNIFKRSTDARKRNRIMFTYTLDVEIYDEDKVLQSLKKDRQIRRTPDTTYHFVAQVPDTLGTRPIVIGTGPCGLFAGLTLAQMGFRPIILERGKAVRERTVDTFAFWRKRKLDPESNVQFGEGGAGHFRTVNSTAKLKIHKTAPERCSLNSSKPEHHPKFYM